MATPNPRQRIQRTGRMESLEHRQVMSGDPLGGLLGGSVQHHAFTDDPAATQGEHPLTPHQGQGGTLMHHGARQGDFYIDYDSLLDNGSAPNDGQISQHLSSAHDSTGLFDVRNAYGFTGSGQTVAIIDSGIAYDHYALGGGLGSGFRVVGGYDYTEENDTDPYDDGTEGSHGTHVAGIVGADGGTDATTGVAPGVDFVGLRVFNDDGDGYFSWVENSLQWVHQNRDSFANPITAVNLSLGTDYNGDEPPEWAMLEDEFAQLEADGIVITVSAGNSFTEFNESGLSYPAASPHVIPVMSVNDNGELSYFSQRHDRALAAPGRWITSTVPDYVGNQNGTTDDWASFSGTSMASPYLAGASVLVREAMQFVGVSDITQDTIYDHIRATSDVFFDSATNANYHRLNMQEAIDALMPADDYGSTAQAAHDLGTLSGTSQLSGLVGTLDDDDFFTFIAGATGSVSFNATATHNLSADWQLVGGGGTVSGDDGEIFTIDVTAGQSYTIALSTTDGIGYYDLGIDVEASMNPIDWGTVGFAQHNDMSNSDESWYQVQASQTGMVSFVAAFDHAAGNVDLQLYDSAMSMVDESATSNGSERVDVTAAQGEVYYLRVTGANNSIDFSVANLVAVDGSTVNVTGTDAGDEFAVVLAGTHTVTVNSIEYTFDSAEITAISVDGGSGFDSVHITGTAAADTATIRAGQIDFSGGGFTVVATSVESTYVDAAGGADLATFYDSAAHDLLRVWPQWAIMEADDYVNQAAGFETHYAYSTQGGDDEVRMYDSQENDLFRAWDDHVIMSGSGYHNRADGFRMTVGYSIAGGYDEVRMYDSVHDDLYRTWADKVIMYGTGYYNRADGFELTVAYAIEGGYDEVRMYDSVHDDLYRTWADKVIMYGTGYYNRANGFELTVGYATEGGNDEVRMYDSVHDDLYRTWSDYVIMYGTGYYNRANLFETTIGYATEGGYDEVRMYDSVQDDLYRTWSDYVIMSGSGFYNQADGFELTIGYATEGGYDEVRMYDSVYDDLYRTWSDKVIMYGTGYYNRADGFELTVGYAIEGGNDEVRMYDSIHDDLYRTWSDKVIMYGTGYYNRANNFELTTGYATSGGYDEVRMYDSPNNDLYRTWSDQVIMNGSGFYNVAVEFEYTRGIADAGGHDEVRMYDSINDDLFRTWDDHAIMSGTDYYNLAEGFEWQRGFSSTGNDEARMYDSTSADHVISSDWGASMQGSGYYNQAQDFATIRAYGENGGVNTSDIESVDYLFELVGDWD